MKIKLLLVFLGLCVSLKTTAQISDSLKQTTADSTIKCYVDNIILNQFIIDWLGSPYKYGGNTKKGIDCSGFTQKLYSVVFKTKIPRTCRLQYRHTVRVKKKNLQVGDIVFFKSPRSPSKWHCGIYIGDNKFVNSSSRKSGVIISDLSQTFYKTHYRGAGRIIKNIENEGSFSREWRQFANKIQQYRVSTGHSISNGKQRNYTSNR